MIGKLVGSTVAKIGQIVEGQEYQTEEYTLFCKQQITFVEGAWRKIFCSSI